MRESLACANCVVKKTGCDRKRPSCSACRRSGLACLYRETIPAGRHMSGHHNGVSKKLASSASSAATAAAAAAAAGLSSPHTPVQHQASSSGQTTQQHMSIARTLQDRIERLEAIVSMHQKVNSLGADDPVNPATFREGASSSALAGARHGGSSAGGGSGAGASGGSPPLAREDLKAFFIASLRPHLVLLTADQVIFCAAENPLVTYAMCALAALFVPEQFLPLRRARELFLAYFGEAKACMSAAFDDPKPSSVFGLLLLTIASSADRGPKVTYYYGSVVQMAMRIGLNSEEVIASSPESEFYKALMRNIWWSIYILDRWFMAAGLGLDTIKDADCRVALPMPEYLERPSSKNALQERIELEIALVTTSSPFIPALPDLGLDACLVMLSKIFGRIVETNREAALNHTCMDIITQRSLARSLDDLYASIPEVARKPDVLLAMSSSLSASHDPLLFTPNAATPHESTPRSAAAEWALNKWKSVFALAQLLGSRVTLYRYTLLRRMERSQSAETVSSVDFVESFNAVVDTMNLIRMLEQHGASFGSLFALMLTDLFSVALTLPVCFVLPLSPSDKALADAALECLCTTLDILSNGIAPSPSYSHVIRTICASRDPEFVVRAVKLAAENMDSPSLPNDSGVPEGPQSTMLLRYFYRLSSTPSSSAPAPTPPSKPEPTGSRVLPHPLKPLSTATLQELSPSVSASSDMLASNPLRDLPPAADLFGANGSAHGDIATSHANDTNHANDTSNATQPFQQQNLMGLFASDLLFDAGAVKNDASQCFSQQQHLGPDSGLASAATVDAPAESGSAHALGAGLPPMHLGQSLYQQQQQQSQLLQQQQHLQLLQQHLRGLAQANASEHGMAALVAEPGDTAFDLFKELGWEYTAFSDAA